MSMACHPRCLLGFQKISSYIGKEVPFPESSLCAWVGGTRWESDVCSQHDCPEPYEAHTGFPVSRSLPLHYKAHIITCVDVLATNPKPRFELAGGEQVGKNTDLLAPSSFWNRLM